MLMLLFGPSGVGKSSIIERLVDYYSFSVVKTFTTRPERRDDRFKTTVSESEFITMIRSGLIYREKEFVNGFRYGEDADDLRKSRESKSLFCLDMNLNFLHLYDEFMPVKVLVIPESARQLADQLAKEQRSGRIETSIAELTKMRRTISCWDGPVLVNRPGYLADTAHECAHWGGGSQK